MEEIAEAMTDGTLCVQCGVYIGTAIGYPIKCQDCQRKSYRKRKKKAFASFARGYAGRDSAWTGIVNYLKVTYEIDCYKKGNQKRTKRLINGFLMAENLANKKGYSNRATWYNANVVQTHFNTFANWLKNQDLSHF